MKMTRGALFSIDFGGLITHTEMLVTFFIIAFICRELVRMGNICPIVMALTIIW